MGIIIRQENEDKYGNAKENIFHAFDDKEQYIGTGYVYPTINKHQTNETPYLLFVEINVGEHPQAKEARQLLFEAVMKRANELRKEKQELKCRIYAGFEWNQEKMDFYLSNGYEEDYSIVMEAELAKNEMETLSSNVKIEEFSVFNKEDFESYKKEYDEYFVTPLDEGFVEEQMEDATFKNFRFYLEGQMVGAFSVKLEDQCGWIETLYVKENFRGRGIAKMMMHTIHQYFVEKGMTKAKLEVWELNTRAVNLYKSFGYKEIQKNCMFPGITV